MRIKKIYSKFISCSEFEHYMRRCQSSEWHHRRLTQRGNCNTNRRRCRRRRNGQSDWDEKSAFWNNYIISTNIAFVIFFFETHAYCIRIGWCVWRVYIYSLFCATIIVLKGYKCCVCFVFCLKVSILKWFIFHVSFAREVNKAFSKTSTNHIHIALYANIEFD